MMQMLSVLLPRGPASVAGLEPMHHQVISRHNLQMQTVRPYQNVVYRTLFWHYRARFAASRSSRRLGKLLLLWKRWQQALLLVLTMAPQQSPIWVKILTRVSKIWMDACFTH